MGKHVEECDRNLRFNFQKKLAHLRCFTGIVHLRFSGPTYFVWITRSSDENQMIENCFRRLPLPCTVQETSMSPKVWLSRSSWWIKRASSVSKNPVAEKKCLLKNCVDKSLYNSSQSSLWTLSCTQHWSINIFKWFSNSSSDDLATFMFSKQTIR